ncbi:hypothetical protein HPSJM_01160 [Helicobacter pylori SJM180]|nr:hypothetical protein HPSJM_01160 [Helicobacter pylori SJM180]
MESFGVRVLFLIPTPFSLIKTTKPTQALHANIHLSIAYKSGVMLDKVTKACYNFLALFCFCSFYALVVKN